MNILKYKGKRIRASDKNLVYRFCAGTLLLLFVAVLLLLNMGQLMRTDWEHFSLLENGVTLSTYNFITIGIATGVCALVAFLYYRFFHDSFKKLLHRQKLSRMILDNKWYEAQTVQDSGFFTDLQSRSREKIVWSYACTPKGGCLKHLYRLAYERGLPSCIFFRFFFLLLYIFFYSFFCNIAYCRYIISSGPE